MKSRERISVLFVREATGDSWSLRLPTALFRVLVVAFVLLIVLAGFAATWLGAIAVRLQAADVVAKENQRLQTELDKVSQLQDELRLLSEQQKRIFTLTQAWIDDPALSTQNGAAGTQDPIFGTAARTAFLDQVNAWEKRQSERRRSLVEPVRPQLLLPPVQQWTLPAGQNGWSTSTSATVYYASPSATVRAPATGVVLRSGWDPVLGLSARLLIGGGYEISLGQLGELDVQAGDLIQAGTPIGRTTRGSGDLPPQLAILLQLDGVAIDPSIAMMR